MNRAKTHCPRGHAYDEANTYILPKSGAKVCRACQQLRYKATYVHSTTRRKGQTDEQRFWPKVNRFGPVSEHRPDLGRCWLWTAALDNKGYGVFFFTNSEGKKKGKAHQFSFDLFHGPMPDGHEPDHLCRVTACCRPSHLEAVTHRENMLRGDTIAAKFAAKTHCPQGHPYDDMNTIRNAKGYRRCRICAKAQSRKQSEKRRLARAS
jgi:hypothetical protein